MKRTYKSVTMTAAAVFLAAIIFDVSVTPAGETSEPSWPEFHGPGRTNVSAEQLVVDLQAWCKSAEESGIAVLQEFALKLRAAKA